MGVCVCVCVYVCVYVCLCVSTDVTPFATMSLPSRNSLLALTSTILRGPNPWKGVQDILSLHKSYLVYALSFSFSISYSFHLLHYLSITILNYIHDLLILHTSSSCHITLPSTIFLILLYTNTSNYFVNNFIFFFFLPFRYFGTKNYKSPSLVPTLIQAQPINGK